MNAIDFEYDGQYLSDYGFIICDFNAPSGADFVTAGSVLSFNRVSKHYGKSFSLISTRYDECITTSFDICKNPDENDDMEITSDEFRDLARWLGRKQFYEFHVFDSEREFDDCYLMGSFNIEKIKIHETLYGLHLTLETDKPFGYGAEKTINIAVTNTSVSHSFYDWQDEIGYFYPKVVITCKENGNLSIHNTMCDCTTVINNCTNGEVITLNGDTQTISSSNSNHDICNDFNFQFFQIGNTYNDRKNTVTATIKCEINIIYRPIIKDVQ